MPGNTLAANNKPAVWLWALFPMLLAAALVVPILNRDIFDVDEASTMIVAGARRPGPWSILEAVNASVTRWPGVGLGQVLAHVMWGRLVGWSEFAVRSLPWFLGILSLAWIYRTGRDLFNARVAVTATLLLSTSVVFLTYMHIARSYGAALLFATMALWGYWRVALDWRPAGIGERVALVLGMTGLLYAHYLGALLLPALGLFHLLFARRGRRWWLAVMLSGLALLLAAPNLTDLFAGIDANLARKSLHKAALHYPEVISLLVRYLSSGLLNPRFPFNSLVIPVLIVATALVVWRSRSPNGATRATRFLAVTAALLLLFVLGVNEWLRVLEPRRVRYLVTLWPPVLLLAGAVSQTGSALPWRVVAAVSISLVAVTGVKEFTANGSLVGDSWYWTRTPVSIPVTDQIAARHSVFNLLLVDVDAFRYENRSYEFYTGMWGERREVLRPDSDSRDLVDLAWNHERILLLVRKSAVDSLNVEAHLDLFSQEGWYIRDSWQDDNVTLLQLDSPLLAGSADQSGLEFDRDIRMTGFVAALRDNHLAVRVGLQSLDDYLLAHYSLAVHIIDSGTGERVAQGDVGVGPGAFVPVYSETDIGELPAGGYEVHVALYDWQTGERLNARDLQTGAISDMHLLHQFHID